MMGFFVFMATLVLGILAVLGGIQWLEGRRSMAPSDGAWRGQLERLETAVGVLESRLDDLEDQQRFLERLLAERPGPQSLPRPSPPSGEQVRSDSILFDRDGEES
ncbi:MAG: hypothetical protein GWM90_20580 [Gemmatimonadetes bacterium]|nr:hypothetical protein [Gemmatimonadota bacterium]NIQ56873.1 hypothetical protein [Gemmatimonadota bacterium]NIU77052.1 hypothetical protein [Gammaproteobacteria bacterium]NIX46395.1 hypothetical protein [Gemmatimonadota bacterium]